MCTFHTYSTYVDYINCEYLSDSDVLLSGKFIKVFE